MPFYSKIKKKLLPENEQTIKIKTVNNVIDSGDQWTKFKYKLENF